VAKTAQIGAPSVRPVFDPDAYPISLQTGRNCFSG
jgi:hypothetical protein